MSASQQRIELTPGLVLHQRPWRDTSLIVELYTAQHGRITTFARGVRGASGARNRFTALRPFQPLLLSWFGRGEAPRLIAAEPDGAVQSLPPAALLSAWYLNELLQKLTVQHDPQPEIYALYRRALAELQAGGGSEWVLRRFERRLLELLGFGINFDGLADSGQPLSAQQHYHYLPGAGFALTAPDQPGAISGHVVLGLANEAEFAGSDDWRAARQLMRSAIDHCLDGRELRTRRVARAVLRSGGSVHAR
jgi:DNA repair protein RecO (recombination protein O)